MLIAIQIAAWAVACVAAVAYFAHAIATGDV